MFLWLRPCIYQLVKVKLWTKKQQLYLYSKCWNKNVPSFFLSLHVGEEPCVRQSLHHFSPDEVSLSVSDHEGRCRHSCSDDVCIQLKAALCQPHRAANMTLDSESFSSVLVNVALNCCFVVFCDFPPIKTAELSSSLMICHKHTLAVKSYSSVHCKWGPVRW